MDYLGNLGKHKAEGQTVEVAVDPLKRQKVHVDADKPSKVLHLRGLPGFATEQEVALLVSPYGKADKIFLMPQKYQGFVQMDSVESAQLVVASTTPFILRSRPVYFQFSTRQEVSMTVKSAPAVTGAPGESKTAGGEYNSILLVSILNARVPVTLDNIHTVFRPYGDVLKIITFMKDNVFQALVQMGSMEAAITAKAFLEGKDMFQGCCTLRIAFSQRRELTVKQNGAKSRDFTVPYTPPSLPNSLYNPYGLSLSATTLSASGLPGIPPPGSSMADLYGAAARSSAAANIPSVQGSAAAGTSPVVLVNNLDNQVTPDMLFTLFGLYGDVLRVKILFAHRDTAMVQFVQPQQASYAVQFLNKAPLFGRNIVVSASKNYDVKLPRVDQDEAHAGLTKDYTGSPLHRYKNGQFNLKAMNIPSATLHVANIHDGCTEAELAAVFAPVQNGKSPVVQFFTNNRKMAYVKMESKEMGVMGLIRCHNLKLKAWNIRVSFSPKEVTAESVPGDEGLSASASSTASSDSLPL